ncbi:hypothetical protein K439DRAFT_1656213 [Ramaria rubella]|nr:hypothetical protein K439DRAFT_1656213 [Ramaria rubella]
MDAVISLLKVAQSVGQVPGLSAACSLTVQILTAVQKTKHNKNRLHGLACSVVEIILQISQSLAFDSSGSISIRLKSHIAHFEKILEEILIMVIRYSETSRFSALLNAGTRKTVILTLEKRLENAQRSILLLVDIETYIALNDITALIITQQIQAAVQFQHINQLLTSPHFFAHHSLGCAHCVWAATACSCAKDSTAFPPQCLPKYSEPDHCHEVGIEHIDEVTRNLKAMGYLLTYSALAKLNLNQSISYGKERKYDMSCSRPDALLIDTLSQWVIRDLISQGALYSSGSRHA